MGGASATLVGLMFVAFGWGRTFTEQSVVGLRTFVSPTPMHFVGDYPLDLRWGLVAALADATIGASPRAQARMFRAAMTSAGPACPHRQQLNSACERRFRLST